MSHKLYLSNAFISSNFCFSAILALYVLHSLAETPRLSCADDRNVCLIFHFLPDLGIPSGIFPTCTVVSIDFSTDFSTDDFVSLFFVFTIFYFNLCFLCSFFPQLLYQPHNQSLIYGTSSLLIQRSQAIGSLHAGTQSNWWVWN